MSLEKNNSNSQQILACLLLWQKIRHKCEMQNRVILIMGCRQYEFSIFPRCYSIHKQSLSPSLFFFFSNLVPDKNWDCFLRKTKPVFADFKLAAFSVPVQQCC